MTRFDTIIITTIASLILLTSLIIWRGDQIGAQVVSVSPVEAATQVSSLTAIEVTFAQPMRSTVDQPLVISPPVSGTITWQQQRLIFRPTTAFEPNTTYQITLADGLTSRQGRQMLGATSWQFTTRSAYILFIAPDADQNDQLYLLDEPGGTPRALTREPEGVFDFTIAPDGTRVVYAAWQDNGTRYLKLLEPTTGQVSALLDCPQAACNGVIWEPTGERLIYERRQMLVPNAAPGPPRLWWLNPATSETVTLFDDSQSIGYGAAWSPDGAWLAYVAPSSQGVQIYNLNDQRSVLIPSRTGALPVWSHNSQYVIATDIQGTDAGFSVRLFRANPDAGELIDISGPNAQVEDSAPIWSPDNQQIIFTRKAAGTSMGKQLWLMNPDGTEAQPLTNLTDFHHSFPAWSPNGRYILYQRFPLKELGAASSIWRYELATGEMIELVAQGNQPEWLP